MLKLLLGRAGSGKTTAMLRAAARNGGERRQLILVPEQASHDTERAPVSYTHLTLPTT